MNASKITVPANVATAIRHYTDLHETKHEAFANILQLGYEAERSEAILRHFDGDYDLLMEALICGYQIEKSPEEKVREYYEHSEEKRRECTGPDYHGWRVKRTTIKTTLSMLGIKMEGVNA